MRIRKSSSSVLVVLIGLFLASSIGGSLLHVGFLNRIIGFLIAIITTLLLMSNGGKRTVVILSIILVMGIISIISAVSVSKNIVDMIYWIVATYFFLIMSSPEMITIIRKEFVKHRNFLWFVVIVCECVLIIGFFDENCYSATWHGQYYTGYTYSEHTLCSGCCLLLCMILGLLKDRKYKTVHFILFLSPVIAILASGARVFFISLICILFVYYSKYIENKSLKLVLFPIVCVAMTYFFLNSNMIAKFNFVQGNKYISDSVVGQLSSGRSEFWSIDIRQFLAVPFYKKLFGSGFDFPYAVNKIQYGLEIWSHNDFIDLLLSVGLFGTTVYLGVVVNWIKKQKSMVHKKLYRLIIVGYVLLPMMINGVFIYQHYLYSIMFLQTVLQTDRY